jgi:hypothetical protein
MGWKSSIIVISNSKTADEKQTLKVLGFSGIEEISSKTFEEVLNPEDNEVYIGTYKNHLIICNQELPIHFYEDDLSKVEISFINNFPNTEIATFILNSGVNLWGFSILKGYKKLRVKSGSSADGTIVDFGKEIEEEKALLSFSKKQKEDTRKFRFENDEEEYTEDQVGENLIFNVSRRYFGVGIDENEELLETKFNGYKYSVFKLNRALEKNKKWYKNENLIIYLIGAIILIYNILKITIFKK